MTRYMDLLGKSHEEIDKELLSSHENLIKHLKIVKETIKDMNSSKMVPNFYFDKLQYLVMDSAGYMTKNVNYTGKEVIVTFTETITPAKELVGRGKNELEAICNACDNLVENPSEYNTHSKKYLDKLKK